MTSEEQAIVDRHKKLTKEGWRDPDFVDNEKDGYCPCGIAILMCICDTCQKAVSERWRSAFPPK
jgi:hypothetical protein